MGYGLVGQCDWDRTGVPGAAQCHLAARTPRRHEPLHGTAPHSDAFPCFHQVEWLKSGFAVNMLKGQVEGDMAKDMKRCV